MNTQTAILAVASPAGLESAVLIRSRIVHAHTSHASLTLAKNTVENLVKLHGFGVGRNQPLVSFW